MQKLLPSQVLFFSIILPCVKGFHPYECPCMPPLPLKPCGHPFHSNSISVPASNLELVHPNIYRISLSISDV